MIDIGALNTLVGHVYAVRRRWAAGSVDVAEVEQAIRLVFDAIEKAHAERTYVCPPGEHSWEVCTRVPIKVCLHCSEREST